MPEKKGTAAEVVLYCTQWCPSCRSARLFLKEHQIEYVEVDITRDRDAAARVRGWADGDETTPTFDIGGKIVVDWDKEKVSELLGIK
jgi:glutaredoxin 3